MHEPHLQLRHDHRARAVRGVQLPLNARQHLCHPAIHLLQELGVGAAHEQAGDVEQPVGEAAAVNFRAGIGTGAHDGEHIMLMD